MQELKQGSFLQGGKYRIEKMLGQGGFGITYEGVQRGLNRRVAIKEFFMKEYYNRDSSTSHVSVGSEGSADMVNDYRQKFLKEAQLIAHLEEAPHVVRIYDIFEENGTAYYVMQYVEGGSLDELVKREGPLPEARAIEIMCQTAEALATLHEQQTMHLDVKPSNILLRCDKQGNDHVVLIDFGVSKHYDQGGHQTTSTPVGISKGYAALEQYREGGVSQFSPTADVYSLGATLYFLLTGQRPPEAADLLTDGLECPQGLSQGLWMVLSKAMSIRPRDRYLSMTDITHALRAVNTADTPNKKVAAPHIVTSEDTVITPRQSTSVETVVSSKQPVPNERKAADNNLVIFESLYGGHKFGYKNKLTDEIVIPCNYSHAASFSEGLACVADENGQYGFIDRNGNIVIPFIYKEAGSFNQGLARIIDDNLKEHYINKEGQIVQTVPGTA